MSFRLRETRPKVPPRASRSPAPSTNGVSLPTPVAASEADVPEPELPELPELRDEPAAEVTGAIVVVVEGTVVVVDVVVELEVVVAAGVVVVVVEVGAVAVALGVTVQQELKVCGAPGAAALTPAVLGAVEYSQSA